MHTRLPVVGGQVPPWSGDDGPRFLSQSEGGDWLACGVKAYARWVLGLRDGDESPRQQVGSMGHAILADRVTARFRGGEPGPHLAATIEAERRGWGDGWSTGLAQAADAAHLVAREMNLDHAYLLPDLYSDDHLNYVPPRPLAEVRLRVPWGKVLWTFTDVCGSPGRVDLQHCQSVMSRFAGLEGQPDLVCLPEGPGGVVAIDDYKFRQRPDLGAPQTAAPRLPDRQGSWYLTILRALGLHAPSGFIFRQVNVYAGRWLGVDDFLAPNPGPLVTDRGLPTRDLNRLADAGGMVTVEVWGEAHRLLAQRRLDARFAEWNHRGKKGRYPEAFSAAEEADARRFLETLRAWRPVDVRTFRADPLVCREVVRDVVVGVEGPLSLALRGVTPARHLQTYPGAPCTRAYGCPVASPCQSSLGTFGVADALRSAAEDAHEAREAARETEAAYA